MGFFRNLIDIIWDWGIYPIWVSIFPPKDSGDDGDKEAEHADS